MPVTKIKVEENEVEVLNSATDKEPKVTKIKADDDSSSDNPFEQMFENNPQMKDNPMMKIMGNMGEIKKIKAYFFFSIVCGLIALFALREYMGPAAVLLGALDLWKGSALTKTASYFGIFCGLAGLAIHFS